MDGMSNELLCKFFCAGRWTNECVCACMLFVGDRRFRPSGWQHSIGAQIEIQDGLGVNFGLLAYTVGLHCLEVGGISLWCGRFVKINGFICFVCREFLKDCVRTKFLRMHGSNAARPALILLKGQGNYGHVSHFAVCTRG